MLSSCLSCLQCHIPTQLSLLACQPLTAAPTPTARHCSSPLPGTLSPHPVPIAWMGLSTSLPPCILFPPTALLPSCHSAPFPASGPDIRCHLPLLHSSLPVCHPQFSPEKPEHLLWCFVYVSSTSSTTVGNVVSYETQRYVQSEMCCSSNSAQS